MAEIIDPLEAAKDVGAAVEAPAPSKPARAPRTASAAPEPPKPTAAPPSASGARAWRVVRGGPVSLGGGQMTTLPVGHELSLEFEVSYRAQLADARVELEPVK